MDEVFFPAMSGSWTLTSQTPMVVGTVVSAFSWGFVTQEVFTLVQQESTAARI